MRRHNQQKRSQQKIRNLRLCQRQLWRWQIWWRRLWPRIIWRPPSFPSWKFWPPMLQLPSVSPGWKPQPPSHVPGRSIAAPPHPWRRLRPQHSPPLSRLRPIWNNLKQEDKIWSFYGFSRAVWNESENNLKRSEIWRHNLKLFLSIWNKSETSLKTIWKIHQSEIYFGLIIWSNLKHTETILEAWQKI